MDSALVIFLKTNSESNIEVTAFADIVVSGYPQIRRWRQRKATNDSYVHTDQAHHC